MDGVCAADRLHSCFRKPEVLDLTFLNQVLHRSSHVFDWHVRINAMLIEEIDGIGLESLEGRFGDLLHVLRPTIRAALLVTRERESELGRDHHLITHGSERLAKKFFVCERAVRFSSVEERYAAFYGSSNQ